MGKEDREGIRKGMGKRREERKGSEDRDGKRVTKGVNLEKEEKEKRNSD